MQKKLYRQVFVKDLENGMIIGRDILNANGEILLAKNFQVTSALTIKRLLTNHDITFVSILRDDIPVEVEDIAQEEITPTLTELQTKDIIKVIDEFNENREAMKQSFNKLVNGEKVEKEDIEKKVENTLKVFEENINVFQIMQNVKHLDDITYSHCHNVALISYTIGYWLGLKKEDLEELALAGMLTDIGKVQIDDKLLNKEGKLTNDEFVDLKKHSILSHEIIKDYEFISDRVKRAVLLHHERMDGSGYPLGLEGKRIPLFSRIIAIADVYNALISDRPHRSKKTPFEAIRILEMEYINKLDTSILYLFLRRIASNYIGQKIVLNNGGKGEIVFIPQHNIYRPVVKMLDSEHIVDLGDAKYESLDIIEFI